MKGLAMKPALLSPPKAFFFLTISFFIFCLFTPNASAQPVVSNVNDVTFTVSWMSSVSMTGEVRYGSTLPPDNTAYDIRGECTIGTTHYVKITNLMPETQYYFDVVTGEAVDDNGGAHYSIATGPTSDTPPVSDYVYGQAFLEDGTTEANGALVFVSILDDDGQGSSGQSSIQSSIVESGYWNVQLANARLLDLIDPFDYSSSGDLIQISVYAPDGTTASSLFDTGNDSPAPTLQTQEVICTDEVCDGIDNDCDSFIDEEGAQGCTILYRDQDKDNFGVTDDYRCLCAASGDYRALKGGDTDDQDPTIYPGAEWTVNMELPSGWSMISLPVEPDDTTINILFPDSEAIFRFTTQYELMNGTDPLVKGEGYWIYLNEPRTYVLTGAPIQSYTIEDAKSGWSMIGGCSSPALPSVENGSIQAVFGFSYKYDFLGSGATIVPLQSGKGFWIHLSEQATLTLQKTGL